MSTTAATTTYVERVYATSKGVETRWVPSPRGTHVLTASGTPLDVTSGAVAAARTHARLQPALRARAQRIVARVAHVEAASRAARERQEAAERLRTRRKANEAIRAHVERRAAVTRPPAVDAGRRPVLVWRAVDRQRP